MGCGDGEPHAIPASQPSAGKEWDVVRSVVVEAQRMDDLVVTVEGDQVLHRWDYQATPPSVVGVIKMREAGEEVSVLRFPREVLASKQVGLGEPAGRSVEVVEGRWREKVQEPLQVPCSHYHQGHFFQQLLCFRRVSCHHLKAMDRLRSIGYSYTRKYKVGAQRSRITFSALESIKESIILLPFRCWEASFVDK